MYASRFADAGKGSLAASKYSCGSWVLRGRESLRSVAVTLQEEDSHVDYWRRSKMVMVTLPLQEFFARPFAATIAEVQVETSFRWIFHWTSSMPK
jgi:hypothetical protein